MALCLDGCVNEVGKRGDVRLHSRRRRHRDGALGGGTTHYLRVAHAPSAFVSVYLDLR